MKKLLRLIAVAVLGLGVATTGIVAADTANVDETGPDSTVTIDFAEDYDATVDNTASVTLSFDNTQDTETGEAEVDTNTGGGSAITGDAESMNDTMVEGEIDNSGANAMLGASNASDNKASVSNTGPNSDVTVDFNNTNTVSVTNDTTLNITNNNDQTTTSGDATVSNNTDGGDAETGNSSASSSSSFSFTVKN